MGGLNQNDDNYDTFRGRGVWDLNVDMMTQQNKVATAMIYHPLLAISILIVTLLASTNLSIMAPCIAGLSLSPSWAVAGTISADQSGQPARQYRGGQNWTFPRSP